MGDEKEKDKRAEQQQSTSATAEGTVAPQIIVPDVELEQDTEYRDMQERLALDAVQRAETKAVQDYNKAVYANQADIIKDIEGKIGAAQQKDADAERRDKAYRYISGLGDTLSGVANLVGVANGAANQTQHYNSPAVVEKAEAERKARKLEMDQLSNRLDEMRNRERELKAAGSLSEAQQAAQHKKEKMMLESQQRTQALENKYKQIQLGINTTKANNSGNKSGNNSGNRKSVIQHVSSGKPSIVKLYTDDGRVKDYDVQGYKNFHAEYQKALDALIQKGESGLSEAEIAAYTNATSESDPKEKEDALKDFFRTHGYRERVVNAMRVGAKSPYWDNKK